ncbi:CDC27 family protein [Paenibacillus brevis]|uniref:CDC27 family protein n=1 Tax=Paenibacillus brevis TaxID=2841508 RepID=A0ABS6FRK1_9BACL|nr:CDC27 family protein [Paenibacillus brevis]MBU5672604.1 CDC27 family protein [Paenibacillus brevis]
MLLQQMLNHGETLLRKGASDTVIFEALQKYIHHPDISPEEGREWLFTSLYRLGAYTYAIEHLSPLLLEKEHIRRQYAECLIRTGQYQAALNTLENWVMSLAPEQDMTELHPQLELWVKLCRLAEILVVKGSPEPALAFNELPLDQIQALMGAAVKMGVLPVASALAASDEFLRDDYILVLYKEGYVELARLELNRIGKEKLSEEGTNYRHACYIYAEILHDEGQFEEAAGIFERIAEQFPDMAKARFGACSCYLHTVMNRLTGRIELYRPGREEQSIIERHLDDISRALNIIYETKWHTVWPATQSRNLPIPASQILQ